MDGNTVWKKVFNTDFEKAVLNELNIEKTFEDMGTDEENKEIVEALDGWTYERLFDCYFDYYGHGFSFSDLVCMFDMLQIEDDWNKAKEEESD
jgi:hypothetical protein